MTPPLVHQVRRDLEAAVERIDRESITHWLMMFSSEMPLLLDHPRMGAIAFQGLEFSGTVVDVYDRYVLLVIDDLVAETTVRAETALPSLAREERAAAVDGLIEAISAAKARLLARAKEIKSALEGRRRVGARAHISEQINWTPYAERLRHTLRIARTRDMTEHRVSRHWFGRYQTALDRMRSAEPNQFAARAHRLASVLREPEVADVRAMLTDGLELEPFLKKARSDEVEFGDPFPFPTNTAMEMGVAILLLDHLATDDEIAHSLALNHYDVSGDPRIVASWIRMVDQVYAPLAAELADYLDARGWLAPESAAVLNAIRVEGSTGVTIQQGVNHGVQSVHINGSDIATALSNFETLTTPLIAAAERADFDAEIRTLRAQLDKKRANPTILKESGATLRSLIEGVAAGTLTPPAIAAALQLWGLLGLS